MTEAAATIELASEDGLTVKLVVAPTCAEAEEFRRSAPQLTITICQCVLFRLLLDEASAEEKKHIGQGRWLFGESLDTVQ
jgi:hypothetical protein